MSRDVHVVCVDPPSAYSLSPLWPWWAVWPSAEWALQSESHTERPDMPQIQRRSPVTHIHTVYTYWEWASRICPTKHNIQYISIILFLVTLTWNFCNILTPFQKKSAKVSHYKVSPSVWALRINIAIAPFRLIYVNYLFYDWLTFSNL